MNHQDERIEHYMEARRTPSTIVCLSAGLFFFCIVFMLLCAYTLFSVMSGKHTVPLANLTSTPDNGATVSDKRIAAEIGTYKRAVLIEVPRDFKSIQAAIYAAPAANAVIRVAPGIYAESISFGGKNIVLTSKDPKNPQLVSATVIDGNRSEYTVNLEAANTCQTVLTGFSIRNGKSGGVAGNGSTATISFNNINKNEGNAWVYGIRDANGTIEYNNIFQNRGSDTGVGIRFCNGDIRGNRVFENYGGKYSYGIRDCHGTIEANQIYDNCRFPGLDDSPSGRGIFYCNGSILNNQIYNNSGTDYGYGIKDCGGLIEGNIISSNIGGIAGRGVYGCSGTIRLNTIEGNSHYSVDNCPTAVIAENRISSPD